MKGAGSISGKSEHNYRVGHVPNADPEREHLNHEYVLNYENLTAAIEGRIQNSGIHKTRHDAVKGMEFILSASPERFGRDEKGQTIGDYQKSNWVAANLEFMKQQYGPNLVAFTLHQDEKTPHIHAVVVPITPDGRLCAKELFSPKTLRQLQTDYAQAMKPFGLERGIEGSRAKHVEMKRIYGMQQAERLTIERELTPVQEAEPLQIEKPGALDLLNLERWKQQQEARLNAQYAQKIAEFKEAAEKAQNIAVANATAREQGKVLQQRLDTSEGLKQANHEKAEQTGQKLDTLASQLEKVAVQMEQGNLHPKWSQQTADHAKARVLPQLERDVLASLKEPTHESKQIVERLRGKGYTLAAGKEPDKVQFIEHEKTGIRIDIHQTKFGGQSIYEGIKAAIERTRQEEPKQEQKQTQNRSRGMRM
jgi:hypothetical protein